MLRKMYMILGDFGRQMSRHNINAYAASTAFFFFLSIVPMLMVLCAIIPYTPLTEENLVTAITEVTPERVNPLVISLIEDVYAQSAGVISVAVIATLWSAGKGMLALIRGLNGINGVPEDRNYFFVRLVASFYTVVMLLIMMLSLLAMVFGSYILDFLLKNLPRIGRLVAFLVNFRFLLVWVVLTILFAAIYAYVPNKKLRFREQIPGAVFSAVVWSGFSWGFSLYVGRTDSYSIYGSLSFIIIIMIWMYFCMYIIMIGAYLNHYFKPVNRVLMASGRRSLK